MSIGRFSDCPQVGSRGRASSGTAATVAMSIALALLAAGCSESPSSSTGTASDIPATPVTAEQTAAAPERVPPQAFQRTLDLQGITFRITCPNTSSVNELRLETVGLEADNSPWTMEVDGTVTGAEVADLNGDGSPEVYVFVNSAGSGSYGSLVAYAANNRRSLSRIDLPPLEEGTAASKGYMGHDQFAVESNRLIRRFPIYREGDPNASPSGGTRQLEYRLEPGGAGWRLILDRMADL